MSKAAVCVRCLYVGGEFACFVTFYFIDVHVLIRTEDAQNKTSCSSSVLFWPCYLMFVLVRVASAIHCNFLLHRTDGRTRSRINIFSVRICPWISSTLQLTTASFVLYETWLISPTFCNFYRLDLLPRSFASGSLTAATIRLLIEGYTHRVVVLNGNWSGIDVRFIRSQETITSKFHRGSEVQLHWSGQPVERFKGERRGISVRLT